MIILLCMVTRISSVARLAVGFGTQQIRTVFSSVLFLEIIFFTQYKNAIKISTT